MLCNLRIENIAVVKELDVSFRNGFTVITGQTGAGKSILVDSLLLLCGRKYERDLIRTGEERAVVSGIFSCPDNVIDSLTELGYQPDENGEIELLRVIQSNGHSSAKINNKTVPVSSLREVSALLLELQTQDERNAYSDISTYTALLDSFSDDESELKEYSICYNAMTEIRQQINKLEETMKQRDLYLKVLKMQKKEIDSAHLSADNEEEKLLLYRNKLKSAEKVAKYSDIVTRALSYSEKGATASYLLERAQNALAQISDVIEGADEMISKIESYRYELIDIADRVQNSIEDDDISNPTDKLTQIETRLSLINKLKGKYGNSISEIKNKREEISSQISDLEDGDFRLTQLQKELSTIEEKAGAVAEELSKKRKHAAEKLTKDIIESLKYLDMPKVRFRVSVQTMHEKNGSLSFRPDGCDNVDFLISVNSGEDIQSLGKVSSGGELSRITLAMKIALAEKKAAETLLFDEIDAGVSGATSEKIGRLLSQLSRSNQVISITHSPQIAALADCHLLIEKKETNDRTESSIREIEGDERTAEIARIIGGISITEKQTAAAREMISNSKNLK